MDKGTVENKVANPFDALGNKVTEFTKFETFTAPPGVTLVECTSQEVTSLCPVTGQPDWYAVKIAYNPNAKCVESKTLKLYLQSFRDKGLFCEAFAQQIADDIGRSIDPCELTVEVKQVPRGGVGIVAHARYNKNRIT